jgi:hypothetical protein
MSCVGWRDVFNGCHHFVSSIQLLLLLHTKAETSLSKETKESECI